MQAIPRLLFDFSGWESARQVSTLYSFCLSTRNCTLFWRVMNKTRLSFDSLGVPVSTLRFWDALSLLCFRLGLPLLISPPCYKGTKVFAHGSLRWSWFVWIMRISIHPNVIDAWWVGSYAPWILQIPSLLIISFLVQSASLDYIDWHLWNAYVLHKSQSCIAKSSSGRLNDYALILKEKTLHDNILP